MIDWATVFESAKLEEGATEAEVAALGLPADRPVPPSYLSFVRYSDGGHFRNGDRLFQMLSVASVRQMLGNDLPEAMPLAVPFAFNGGDVLYLFDMREPPDAHGEYPILCAATDALDFDPHFAPRVADDFLEACRDRFNVERLLDGEVVLTARRWATCADPPPMLNECRDRDRPLRLFACACAGRVERLSPDALVRAAIELAERYADDGATDEERRKLRYACEEGTRDVAAACLATSAWDAARNAAFSAALAEAGSTTGAAWQAARAKQADLLREIFGNPLCPTAVDPAWLAWNGRTVPQIAERIYQTRAFGDLPVLADALEDAGCTDAELLTHLRAPREHVRGCWALDLLRGV